MSEPDTEAGRAAGYPYGEFDAREWAADFKRRFPESDEGLMLAWFANAIMTGYDRAANEREAAALAGPGADRPYSTREYLRANLFDGDESGVLTVTISTLLDDLVPVVNEYAALSRSETT